MNTKSSSTTSLYQANTNHIQPLRIQLRTTLRTSICRLFKEKIHDKSRPYNILDDAQSYLEDFVIEKWLAILSPFVPPHLDDAVERVQKLWGSQYFEKDVLDEFKDIALKQKKKSLILPFDSFQSLSSKMDVSACIFTLLTFEHVLCDIFRSVVTYTSKIKVHDIKQVDIRIIMDTFFASSSADALDEFDYISEFPTEYAQAVRELVYFEETFTKHLQIICQFFRQPLVDYKPNSPDIESIFSNISSIFDCATVLFVALDDSRAITDKPMIGVIFYELSEEGNFQCFVQYASEILVNDQASSIPRLFSILDSDKRLLAKYNELAEEIESKVIKSKSDITKPQQMLLSTNANADAAQHHQSKKFPSDVSSNASVTLGENGDPGKPRPYASATASDSVAVCRTNASADIDRSTTSTAEEKCLMVNACRYLLPQLLLVPITHFLYYDQILEKFENMHSKKISQRTHNMTSSTISSSDDMMHESSSPSSPFGTSPSLPTQNINGAFSPEKSHSENSHRRSQSSPTPEVTMDDKESIIQARSMQLSVRSAVEKIISEIGSTRASHLHATNVRLFFPHLLEQTTEKTCLDKLKLLRQKMKSPEIEQKPKPKEYFKEGHLFHLERSRFVERLCFFFDNKLFVCKFSKRQRDEPEKLKRIVYLLEHKFYVIDNPRTTRSASICNEDENLFTFGVDYLNHSDGAESHMPVSRAVFGTKTKAEKESWLFYLVYLQSYRLLSDYLTLMCSNTASENVTFPNNLRGYRFICDESEKFIEFEENCESSSSDSHIIKRATLDQLVEKMTLHHRGDVRLIKVFLMTFRSWCTPHHLFEKLIEATRSKTEAGLDELTNPASTMSQDEKDSYIKIPFYCYRQIAERIDELLKHKDKPYVNLKVVSDIQDFVRNIRPMEDLNLVEYDDTNKCQQDLDDLFYEKSLKIEPRDCEEADVRNESKSRYSHSDLKSPVHNVKSKKSHSIQPPSHAPQSSSPSRSSSTISQNTLMHFSNSTSQSFSSRPNSPMRNYSPGDSSSHLSGTPSPSGQPPAIDTSIPEEEGAPHAHSLSDSCILDVPPSDVPRPPPRRGGGPPEVPPRHKRHQGPADKRPPPLPPRNNANTPRQDRTAPS